MPRRFRTTPWGRTGCDACKRRHKKCDEKKPICSACVRLGLECRKADSFRQANIGGKSLESENAEPSSSYDGFINSLPTSPPVSDPPDDTPGPRRRTSKKRENRSGRPTASEPSIPPLPAEAEDQLVLASATTCLHTWPQNAPSFGFAEDATRLLLSPAMSYFPTVSDHDWRYLEYYIQRQSGMILNAYVDDNPLRSVVVPLVAQSPPLLYAVCSIAAQHWSNQSLHDDSKASRQVAATSYYLRALSGVQRGIHHHLSAPLDTGGVADVDSLEVVLLAAIFLCMHEITKSGVENWRQHLEGVESLWETLMRTRPRELSDAAKFARSFISYHKSVGSVTQHVVATLRGEHSYKSNRKPPAPFMSSLYAVDPYNGLAESQIHSLHDISALLQVDETDAAERSDLLTKIQTIVNTSKTRMWLSDIETLPQTVISATAKERLTDVALAYESTNIAYMHHVMDRLLLRGYLPAEDAENLAESRASLLVTREQAISNCLSIMARMPAGTPEEPGLLPPMFIIACVTQDQDQTRAIMEWVDRLATNFGLGNMRNISELMKRLCQVRGSGGGQAGFWVEELDWQGLLVSLKWDLIIS